MVGYSGLLGAVPSLPSRKPRACRARTCCGSTRRPHWRPQRSFAPPLPSSCPQVCVRTLEGSRQAWLARSANTAAAVFSSGGSVTSGRGHLAVRRCQACGSRGKEAVFAARHPEGFRRPTANSDEPVFAPLLPAPCECLVEGDVVRRFTERFSCSLFISCSAAGLSTVTVERYVLLDERALAACIASLL